MIRVEDLNPFIKEAIEIATEGLPLMDAARLRSEMLMEIERESLCGIIHSKQVIAIVEGVMVGDMARLRLQI